jgi:hypothetical protein
MPYAPSGSNGNRRRRKFIQKGDAERVYVGNLRRII